MNNIQISKNFKLKDFQCGDSGSVVKLDNNLLDKLQLLKDVNPENEDIEDVSLDDEEDTLFDLDYDENPPDKDKILKTFDFPDM